MAFVVYTCLKKNAVLAFLFGVISGAKTYFSHKLGLSLKVALEFPTNTTATPVMDYCVFWPHR